MTELQRLLESGDREIELEVGRSHVRVKRDDVTFTSKLIDGRFPDYEAVIPIGADREVKVDREALALQRAAILSNEKYRGIRVEVSPGNLKISAHNPEQEEAQEEIEADTTVSDLAIGFNVNYLLDALSALRDEEVIIQLRDSNSSALVRESSSEKSRHVVMPLRSDSSAVPRGMNDARDFPGRFTFHVDHRLNPFQHGFRTDSIFLDGPGCVRFASQSELATGR